MNVLWLYVCIYVFVCLFVLVCMYVWVWHNLMTISLSLCLSQEEGPLCEDRSATVSIFSELYRCCIRPHKKRRVDFLANMVRRSGQLFAAARETIAARHPAILAAGSDTIGFYTYIHSYIHTRTCWQVQMNTYIHTYILCFCIYIGFI